MIEFMVLFYYVRRENNIHNIQVVTRSKPEGFFYVPENFLDISLNVIFISKLGKYSTQIFLFFVSFQFIDNSYLSHTISSMLIVLFCLIVFTNTYLCIRTGARTCFWMALKNTPLHRTLWCRYLIINLMTCVACLMHMDTIKI